MRVDPPLAAKAQSREWRCWLAFEREAGHAKLGQTAAHLPHLRGASPPDHFIAGAKRSARVLSVELTISTKAKDCSL